MRKTAWVWLTVVLAAFLAGGCSSSSKSKAADAGEDGDVDARDLAAPCADMAQTLCAQAADCDGDAIVSVDWSMSGSSIDYESVEFCETVFREQCGSDVPASDVPRITDPVACMHDLDSATCADDALEIPSSCSGVE